MTLWSTSLVAMPLGAVLALVLALGRARPEVQVRAASQQQQQDPKPGEKGFERYAEKVPGNEQTIDMLPIPGGTFTMGSPAAEPGRNADEGPQVQVRMAPFWMARTETTWLQYDGFNFDESWPQQKQPDGVSRPTPAYTDMTFGMGRDDHPAICMTQEAARHFCIWLSKKSGHFYRLPTEAEWEWACRAGSTEAYSFGADGKQLADYAWFEGNSDKAYHPVGKKKPNAWGLCDMHGNVAEWCLDEYLADAYATARGAAPRDNPFLVPKLAYPHSVRGGSWQDPPEALRSAARRGSSPTWKQRDPQIPKSRWYLTDAPFVGFRIVRPLREPTAEQRKQYEGL
jgi:formylglycine-generating enzyme required for sulfatase activity